MPDSPASGYVGRVTEFARQNLGVLRQVIWAS